MEYQNEYASKSMGGVATAGLVTGIVGAVGALNNGTLGNLFGGNKAASSDDVPVTRYELNMVRELVAKDTEIAYLKGRDAAKTDSLELYNFVNAEVNKINAKIGDQAVINAQVIANMSCMQGQIAQLFALTKTIIPATSVCPPPMPQYNSWVAPTTTTAAAG